MSYEGQCSDIFTSDICQVKRCMIKSVMWNKRCRRLDLRWIGFVWKRICNIIFLDQLSFHEIPGARFVYCSSIIKALLYQRREQMFRCTNFRVNLLLFHIQTWEQNCWKTEAQQNKRKLKGLSALLGCRDTIWKLGKMGNEVAVSCLALGSAVCQVPVLGLCTVLERTPLLDEDFANELPSHLLKMQILILWNLVSSLESDGTPDCWFLVNSQLMYMFMIAVPYTGRLNLVAQSVVWGAFKKCCCPGHTSKQVKLAP